MNGEQKVTSSKLRFCVGIVHWQTHVHAEQFRLTVIECGSFEEFISIADHSSELLILALSNYWVQSTTPGG